MNSSNQSLLKGIRIFFKIIFIVLIVFIGVGAISHTILILAGEKGLSTLTTLHTLHNPSITLNVAGQSKQPEMLIGMGAVVLRGVPLIMKLVSAVFVFTGLILLLLIIIIIRKMIRDIEQNEIFSLRNAKRLKTIGFLLLAHLILGHGMVLGNSIAMHTFAAVDLGTVIGFLFGDSLGIIIAIVFSFFMAAVFKIGFNIQEENQSFV